jgi:hypothetical protein
VDFVFVEAVVPLEPWLQAVSPKIMAVAQTIASTDFHFGENLFIRHFLHIIFLNSARLFFDLSSDGRSYMRFTLLHAALSF